MSYNHVNDELPDELGSGTDFVDDVRHNLQDIWAKMVYGESIMYQETQVNDITNTSAISGTVGVYITDGAAPGWDMVDHVLLEEFCPKKIVYRRKIDFESETSTHEYIRKVFTWSQEGGTVYKRLVGVDFEFSLSGVDSDYTSIGYAALSYENTTNHELTSIVWEMPDISKYWYYQKGKPDSSDDVVDVFYDIKKNTSALRDLQVFGGVIGWDNNYLQGEYQPLIPFVPGWDMYATLSAIGGQSVTKVEMHEQSTNEIIRINYTWNTTDVDAITSISHDYSVDGIIFYDSHNVAVAYNSTTNRFVQSTTHTIFTTDYFHYDPGKPYDAVGSAVISAVQQNMKALLHCRLFGGGMGHTWNSGTPHYTESYSMLTNVPYWELSGTTYYITVNELISVNYKHKINTTWELNRHFDYTLKKCFYYETLNAITENVNTKIAESKYSLLSDLSISKMMARCALRGDCLPGLYDNSLWTLYGDTWLDTAAPSGADMHIVANDQIDKLLWANHNNCTPGNNTNARTTELIAITGIDNLKIVISNATADTRGNWVTKDTGGVCISGDPLDEPGTTYIERGVTFGFPADATHIMICYTFEYSNEILEVYDADAL